MTAIAARRTDISRWPDITAVRLPGQTTVHVAEAPTPGPFAPACSAGHRRTRIVTATGVRFDVVPAYGEPTTDNVTCRNCRRWHADKVAILARRLGFQYENVVGAIALPERGEAALSHLAHLIIEQPDFAGAGLQYWDCEAIDALAYALMTAGQPDAAARVIAQHAPADTDPGDRHNVEAFGGRTDDAETVAAWSVDYLDTLLNERFPTRCPDTNAAGEQLFTVEINPVTDVRRPGDGTVYLLFAANRDQAVRRAWWFHVFDAYDVSLWQLGSVVPGRGNLWGGFADLRTVTNWPTELAA